MSLTYKAYAKINLMLDIVGKLDNGYHSLFMLMQSVSLCDDVKLEKRESGILVACSEKSIPCDRRNTAYKAAQAFFAETGVYGGAAIEIKKAIPHEAGIAGGSADAAAVICALDKLYGTSLSVRQMVKIGLAVGSDVPFCIVGGTCLVQDSGGAISPLPNLTDCFFVLCKPPRGVSTPAAYAEYDRANRIRHLDRMGMLNAAVNADSARIFSLCNNVFEQVVDVPERVVIKAAMRQHGACACCMSGSGPTVYGVFRSADGARRCAEELKTSFPDTFICTPVNVGNEQVGI